MSLKKPTWTITRMSLGHCGNGCDAIGGPRFVGYTCRDCGCICSRFGSCAPWYRKIYNVVWAMLA